MYKLLAVTLIFNLLLLAAAGIQDDYSDIHNLPLVNLSKLMNFLAEKTSTCQPSSVWIVDVSVPRYGMGEGVTRRRTKSLESEGCRSSDTTAQCALLEDAPDGAANGTSLFTMSDPENEPRKLTGGSVDRLDSLSSSSSEEGVFMNGWRKDSYRISGQLNLGIGEDNDVEAKQNRIDSSLVSEMDDYSSFNEAVGTNWNILRANPTSSDRKQMLPKLVECSLVEGHSLLMGEQPFSLDELVQVNQHEHLQSDGSSANPSSAMKRGPACFTINNTSIMLRLFEHLFNINEKKVFVGIKKANLPAVTSMFNAMKALTEVSLQLIVFSGMNAKVGYEMVTLLFKFAAHSEPFKNENSVSKKKAIQLLRQWAHAELKRTWLAYRHANRASNKVPTDITEYLGYCEFITNYGTPSRKHSKVQPLPRARLNSWSSHISSSIFGAKGGLDRFIETPIGVQEKDTSSPPRGYSQLPSFKEAEIFNAFSLYVDFCQYQREFDCLVRIFTIFIKVFNVFIELGFQSTRSIELCAAEYRWLCSMVDNKKCLAGVDVDPMPIRKHLRRVYDEAVSQRFKK